MKKFIDLETLWIFHKKQYQEQKRFWLIFSTFRFVFKERRITKKKKNKIENLNFFSDEGESSHFVTL